MTEAFTRMHGLALNARTRDVVMEEFGTEAIPISLELHRVDGDEAF